MGLHADGGLVENLDLTPMYLDEIAETIRANIPKDRIPEGELRELLLIYAVLLRAKGAEVTDSDVHDAWAAWMRDQEADHPSLVPYEALPSDVRAQDRVFRIALRNAAAQLGLTGTTGSEFEAILFPFGPPKGEGEAKEAADLYKVMVASSEGLVTRRQGVNTFFLTMNGALLTATGIIAQNSHGQKIAGLGVAVLAVAGFILCLAWQSLITSFGQLNRGKFRVINTLERYMRVSIYAAEWEALGRGENPKIYRSFTSKEIWVPYSLLVVYAIAAVVAVLFGFGVLSLAGNTP